MTSDIFKRFDPWQKQKQIAVFFINRLRSIQIAEHPTESYASSMALAHLISNNDPERLVQEVHVFNNFVRIVRNQKGSFGFACIILDHVKENFSFQSG